MNASVWPDPPRPISGFARLDGHSRAKELRYSGTIHARDLRALLDPQQDDTPKDQERVRQDLITIQSNNLDQIDRMAETVPLFDARTMRYRVDGELAFACALDKPDPRSRLRAMIARAFARADRYAHACAEELDIRARTTKLAAALDGALSALKSEDGILWYKNRPGGSLYEGSMINQALMAYDRLGYSGRDPEACREHVRCGLAVMEELRERFETFGGQGPAYGWPQTGDAQFFFLLRLAEVFAISTGEAPGFSGYSRKGKHWADFARATLHLTGLGVSNFDELSRRMGGKRPDRRRTDFECSFPWQFEEMAGWFARPDPAAPQRHAGPKLAGQLITAGVAIDRRDGGEPLAWREHTI